MNVPLDGRQDNLSLRLDYLAARGELRFFGLQEWSQVSRSGSSSWVSFLAASSAFSSSMNGVR